MLSPVQTIPAVTVSVITATGTGDYDLTGVSGANFGRSLQNVLEDGELYWYHCYYQNNLTAGYEWGWGVYTSSTEVLTRNVRNSSNSDAAVDWAAGNKVLAISASPEFYSQFGLMLSNMKPHYGICVAGSGQSNNHTINVMASETLVSVPNVRDWSTDGAASPAAHAWRVPDPDDRYQDAEGQAQYIGYGRSTSASVLQTAQLTQEVGKGLALITGRQIWTINVSSSGTAFRDATNGWLYDPGSGNTADRLSDEISEAIAAIDTAAAAAGLPAQGITAPHFFIMAQGESDASAGTPSAQWATDNMDFVFDLEQSDRWGVCDRDITKYYFVAPGPLYREKYAFNGHGLLAENSPERIQVITAYDQQSFDEYGHYTGEAVIEIANRIVDVIATTGASPSNLVGVQTTPNWKDPSEALLVGTSGINLWDDDGQSDSMPAAGHFNYNNAGTKFRLDKQSMFITVPVPVGSDWSGYGFERLGRDGTNFTMRFGTGTDNVTYVLSGLPVDQTSCWEWDIVSRTVNGSPASAALELWMTRGLNNGEDYLTRVYAPIKGEDYEYGTTTGATDGSNPYRQNKVLADGNGQQYRGTGRGEIVAQVQTTTGSATEAYAATGPAMADGDRVTVVADVSAKRTDTGTGIFHAMYRFSVSRSGSTTALEGSVHSTVFQSVSGLSVTCAADDASDIWTIDVTGNTSETWDWTLIINALLIPDAA